MKESSASSRVEGFASAAIIEPDGGRELHRRGDGEPRERRIAAPAPYLRHRLPPSGRLFELVKRAVRPLVRVLYVFPVLVLVKAALRGAGVEHTDRITVAFVGVVVLLFALLALLVALYPLVGPRSKRQTRASLALPERHDLDRALAALDPCDQVPLDADALQALCAAADGPSSSEPIRVRGRLSGGPSIDPGAQLLADRWLVQAGVGIRLFSGHHFAVVAEGQPPVVVELDAPVSIAAPYHDRPLVLPPLSDAEPFERWLVNEGIELEVLRRHGFGYSLLAGAEVDLVATDCQVVRDRAELFIDGRPSDLAGEAGGQPYRRRDAADRCLLVRCTPDLPVILRPTEPRGT